MKNSIFQCAILIAMIVSPLSLGDGSKPSVRVGMIGGINDSGLWPALAERFEKETGIAVDTVAAGPKDATSPLIREGKLDVITMHVSDTMADLLADGYVTEVQPFARNEMVIIGPQDDPAGAKGSTDGAKALKKIIDSKSHFIAHVGVGAQTTLHNLLADHYLTLDPATTTFLLEDKQRRVLQIAQEQKGYTLIGRIPFLDGKIPSTGMIIVCRNDPKMRRTYLIGVANPRRFPGAHYNEAKKLVAFLRKPETQAFISEYGKGKYDGEPLFFPVETDASIRPLPKGPSTKP